MEEKLIKMILENFNSTLDKWDREGKKLWFQDAFDSLLKTWFTRCFCEVYSKEKYKRWGKKIHLVAGIDKSAKKLVSIYAYASKGYIDNYDECSHLISFLNSFKITDYNENNVNISFEKLKSITF